MNLTRRQFLRAGLTAGTAFAAAPRLFPAGFPSLPRSPITNRWGHARITRVDVEAGVVFTGKPGQAYNHQQQLASRHGRLFATWSLGIRDEEGPGQRMVMAVSGDGGRSWSEPRAVASPRRGERADTVVVSSGLLIVRDSLVAYSGEWEWSAAGLLPDGTRMPVSGYGKALRSHTDVRISHDEGATWSPPVATLPRVVNYMPPAPLNDGRLIFAGNCTYWRSDDRQGIEGWRRAALPGLPADYIDQYFNMYNGARYLRTDELFNEASFYQTDDGIIHMMLRNEHSPYLGVTESRDRGESWSAPRLTDFTDAICRSHFGRLPDGRFFCASCPQPPKAGVAHGPRTPLVLATSNDGIHFDRHYVLGDEVEHGPRMPGYAKNGRFGYPYLHVLGDHAFVIYSKYKEDICFLRFPLASIAP